MTPAAVSPRTIRVGRVASPWVCAVAVAGGLGLWSMPTTALAQAPVTPSAVVDTSDWTGKPQSAAITRKEAGAALVQGRRECDRERSAGARKTCLRVVASDHAQMLKAISARAIRTGN